jgi:DNA-binding GntR family transcriptional regulator
MGEPLLAGRVYAQLKRDILTCALKPSQAVYEAELAQRYGVSKTPIREALNTLRREGYVQVVPRRGYIVAPISIQDVQQILGLRMILEPSAAALAARHATAEQVQRLRALGQSSGADIPADTFEVDQSFHVAVADASGNPRLARYIAELLEEVERVYNLCEELRASGPPVENRHVGIAEAIAERDEKAAHELMSRAVADGRARVVDALLGSSSQALAPLLIDAEGPRLDLPADTPGPSLH